MVHPTMAPRDKMNRMPSAVAVMALLAAAGLIGGLASLALQGKSGVSNQLAYQQKEMISMTRSMMAEVSSLRQRMLNCGPTAAAATGGLAAATAAAAVPAVPIRQGGIIHLTREIASRNTTLGSSTLMILAPSNDEYVGATILNSGAPFSASILAEMLSYVKPGSTVVDAGCNMGSYSAFFADKVKPFGSVHCFEPQRKMAQLASANSVVNGLSSVMAVHNKALSFAPGSVQMAAKLPDGSEGGQHLGDVEKRGGRINYGGMPLGKGGEAVEAITLDSLNLKNVSFIKIDVQGAEQLMLYGAQETIKRNMPVVAYEDTAAFFNVSQDMIETLKVPPEVLEWKIESFFSRLGYTPKRNGADLFQIPP